jgi:sigma-B regulation protein RsbU (phosphoserine phosphatase)
MASDWASFNPITLIIDDSKTKRTILKRMLASEGIERIWEANNGRQALEMLPRIRPNLIICDIVIPQMDGMSFCKEIRALPEYAFTPIIMQTALAKASERAQVFAAGADDLVHQPFDKQELIARIRMQLTRTASLQKLQEYQSLVETELEIARHMQQLIQPSRDKLEALESSHGLFASAYFQPSFAIGGDSWDVIALDDHRVAFHISDFTGHGVGASINSFRLHALLSQYSTLFGKPAELLSVINQKLKLMLPADEFATLFYGVIDLEKEELCYASAGALPPLFNHYHEQKCDLIDSSGVPLGVVSNYAYLEHRVPFQAGDTLCLYSDALPEKLDEQHIKSGSECFLKEQLNSSLQPPSANGQRQFIGNMLQEMGLLDGGVCHDDLTMVLLSRHL